MSEMNYMRQRGRTYCVHCEYETLDSMSFDEQNAAMRDHMVTAHPNWLTPEQLRVHDLLQRVGKESTVSESPPATIKMTFGMRCRISSLCFIGIYGRTVEEVAERLICQHLTPLEKNNE